MNENSVPALYEKLRAMGLRHKQAMFCIEFPIDLHVTNAAKRAKYSPKTAHSMGTENLKKPKIQKGLALVLEGRMARLEMSQDDVLNELRVIGMSSVEHYELDDEGNLAPTEDAPEGAMRAIQSIERTVERNKYGDPVYKVKYRLWNKVQAITLVGRHAGMWLDKMEHSGKVELGDAPENMTEEQLQAEIARMEKERRGRGDG